MFRSIAEDMVFYLTKKKQLHQENREVYTYALEVVLLNASLLLTLFLISLSMEQLLFFVCFICFFVPLRIFSGGYHAKKSEICFVASIISYIVAMLIAKYNLFLYENVIVRRIAMVMMIVLFVFSPVENRNHPLADYQKRRNKIIVRLMILVNFTLFIVFSMNGMIIASYEIVFVVLNGVLFLMGKTENHILRR